MFEPSRRDRRAAAPDAAEHRSRGSHVADPTTSPSSHSEASAARHVVDVTDVAVSRFVHPAPATSHAIMIYLDQVPAESAVTRVLSDVTTATIQRGEPSGAGGGESPAQLFQVTVDGVEIQCLVSASPSPAGVPAACAHPRFCANLDAAQQHQARIELTATSVDGADSLLVKTAISAVAAALATLPESLALLDFHASLLVDADVYTTLGKDLLYKFGHASPLWAPVWLFGHPNGTLSAHTVGLSSLGFAELQAEATTMEPAEVTDILENLTAYVIETGCQLQPGESFGFTDHDCVEIDQTRWLVDGTSDALLLRL